MLLVDFSLFFYRMYHGAPYLTTSKCVASGFEFMMLKNLQSLQKKYGHIILCLDNAGTSERKKIDDKYKSNRLRPNQEFDLFPRLANIMSAIKSKYHICQRAGQEADDIIFTLCKNLEGFINILTNDKDLFQCISFKTVVLTSFKSKITEWNIEKLFQNFSIRPNHWIFYRSFIGDQSDNLPGIPRIRKKLVAEACRKFIDISDDIHNETDVLLTINRISDYIIQKGTGKECESTENFIEREQHIRNFEIMKLNYNENLDIIEPNGNSLEYERIIHDFEIDSMKVETEF